MAENFGRCPHCKGTGIIRRVEDLNGETIVVDDPCMRCQGTGNDADATRYYEREVL